MSQHKTYDTDIITLRRIFAASPGSNVPVQSDYVLTTGEYGEAKFINPLSISSIYAISSLVSILPSGISSLSTVIGDIDIDGLKEGLSSLSTAIQNTAGTNATYTISSVDTVYAYGLTIISSATNVYLNPTGISTQSISAGNAFLSSLNFIDSGGFGFLTVNSGVLYLNGSPIQGTITQANITSTVVGLGTAGYVSSLSGLISTANLVNLVSTNYLATQLGSTVVGLGSAGYLSTLPSIGGFVSTANLDGLVSSANLANLVSTSYLATQLTSTLIGLGTAGYISTSQLLSTSYGLSQQIENAPGSAVTPATLTSTVIGLGTVGYISSSQLLSTSAGLVALIQNPPGTLTTANLTSTVVGLGTAGYLSTLPSIGGFVSTANLVNLVSTSYFATQLGSTVVGLGSAGYLSTIFSTNQYDTLFVNTISSGQVRAYSITAQIVSSVTVEAAVIGVLGNTSFFGDGNQLQNLAGANITGTLPYTAYGTGSIPLGSINPSGNLTITGNINAANLVNLVSTSYFDSQLTSTVIGLGTVGYVSTATLLSTSYGLAALIQNAPGSVTTANLTSTVIGLGSAGYLSSATTAIIPGGLVSTSFLDSQLTSTVIGLGSAGYLSSATTAVLPGGLVSTSYLDSQLTSTVIGLGSAGYLSSVTSVLLEGLVSTANLANLISTANVANLISTSFFDTQLTSTVVGLGSAGYLSSGFSTLIASSFSSSNASFQLLTTSSILFGTGSGYLTLPNTVIPNLSVGILYASTIVGFNPGGGSIIGGLVSTSYLDTQLTSTVIGLGTAGYLSTIFSTNQYDILFVNTISSGQVFVSSIRARIVSSVTVEAATIGVTGNTTFYGDATYLQNLTAANVVGTLPYTVYGTGSIPLGSINPNGSLTITGNINAANLLGLVSTANLTNLISTANLANLISTSFFDTQLTSTVIGLGSAGYLSTGFSSLIASSFSSSNASFQLLTTSSILFGTGSGYLTLPNTVIPNLSVGILYASTIVGFNPGGGSIIGGLVSTSYLDTQLTSTVIGLGTAGYLSSIPSIGGFISSANLSGLVSTANLGDLVSTANLANLISTTNLANLVSTANLANLISTSFFDTQLTSTVIGLGSAGYLSTGFSSLIASSFSSSNASFQLLTTSSILFGTGSGYLTLPNTVIPNLSVGILYASTIVGFNPGGGSIVGGLVSTSYLDTQLTSTVIGLGTVGYLSTTLSTNQYDILFVNTISSGQVFASYIRARTVSSVTVEAATIGVTGNTSFYGDATYLQNLTAANVVGTLPYTVYGTGSIPLGSINPNGSLTITGNINAANLAGLVSTSYFDTQLTSTVIGLGSAGYLSTGFSSLIASSFSSSNASFQLLTTSSILFGTGTGYLTLPNTVIPNLSVGILYASTIVGFNPGGSIIGGLVSTSYLDTQLTSTVIGLGTAGYLSSIPSIGGFISTANLANLVSTSFFDTQLTSTVIGLGSAGYLSTGFSSLIASSFSSSNASFQLLTTSSILFGTGTGYLTLPNTVIPNLSVGILYASTIVGFNPGGSIIGGLVSTSYLDTQLTSTVIGLGTAGYLSSIPSLGGFVSTANLANLVSTANLANLVSTSFFDTQLTSTIIGLGSAGYLSTGFSSLIASSFSSSNASFQLLTTSSILFGTGTGYLTLPNTVIPNLSVGILYASTIVGFNPGGSIIGGLVSTSYLDTQLTSTILGLGTFGYVSTAQLLSTSLGLTQYISSFIDVTELTSTVVGLGTEGYISSIGLNSYLTSTVIGLGTAGYLSTLPNLTDLISTANLANLISTANLTHLVSTANLANLVSTSFFDTQLTSTVMGLGSAGYLSTGFSSLIASSFSSSNASFQLLTTSSILFGTGSGYLTLPNTVIPNLSVGILYASTIVGFNPGGSIIGGLVSTSYLDTQLTSTVLGLGTAGYISTAQLLSTSLGLSQYISSFIDVTELTSTVVGLGTEGYISSIGLNSYLTSTVIGLGTAGYLSTLPSLTDLISTANLANLVSTANLANLISTANLANLVSTANLVNLVSTANLANLISTANLANLVSTANLVNLISTANLTNLISSANLANLISTSFFDTQITSTVIGLGSAGYLSTGFSSLIASSFSSSNASFQLLTTSSILFGTGSGYLTLPNTVIPNLSVGILYASTIVGFNPGGGSIIGGLVSTSYLDTQLTSTVIGLGTVGYLSSITSIGGFVSTANLANLISTANLANLVSTSFFDTKLGSTVVGLGTAGYVSTLFNVTFISSVQAQASSFSGNLADALTLVLYDM